MVRLRKTHHNGRRLCSNVIRIPQTTFLHILPMFGFGSAVFQCLVWLADLTLSPALATHKFHLEVKSSASAAGATSRASTPHAVTSPCESSSGPNHLSAKSITAAAMMRHVHGLNDKKMGDIRTN